jgi:high affinity Mn2+ porin
MFARPPSGNEQPAAGLTLNRVVIGAEVDATFPSFPDLSGISIGGISNLTSPTLGAETFSETVLASGTARGRIGYTPGSWLFYATGGFAWTYDRLSLTQLNTGATASPFLWRLGYAAGAGVEAPVAPHWTARLEYLFTGYGNSGTSFFGGAQRFNSDFSVQQVRAGLNYQFGADAAPANAWPILTKAQAAPDLDLVNFHGQATFVWQGYPAIQSPYQGPNSLPGGGQGRETADVRCTRAYVCGKAPNCGSIRTSIRASAWPTRTALPASPANRLVLWVGRFSVVDVFDTNKYANSPKTDFLNWSMVNAGTFDYAADGWGYTYGGAAEWYQGRFAYVPASSTCPRPRRAAQLPTASISIPRLANFSLSARSRSGTSCGVSQARSK